MVIDKKYHYKHGTHCWYCDRAFTRKFEETTQPVVRTKDHIYPLKQDGSNRPENKIAACLLCNQLKMSMTPYAFAMYLTNIDPRLKNHTLAPYFRLMKFRAWKLHNKTKAELSILIKPKQ